MDWYNSIRAVQLHYLKVAFPGATDAEVSKHPKVLVFPRLLIWKRTPVVN